MASEVRDVFIRATFELSKADPARWATFVEAFKAYVTHEMEHSLKAPTSDIAVAFGHNRCLIKLRDDFVDIEKSANKVKAPHGTI